MELVDSRRLTGPNLLLAGAGAVLDVALGPGEQAEFAAARIESAARAALEALAWGASPILWRPFRGGFSLAMDAPIDALYAATEILEWAFADAQARAETGESSGTGPQGDELLRLREAVAQERNPALLALEQAALARHVSFCTDEDWTTVGMGVGSSSWPTGELPTPEAVDWARVRDVPSAMVTGTNGKTTTVRMLCAIARAAGRTPGSCSTDRIEIGEEILERGDWSGPGGARAVVRARSVDLCAFETARGGLLRRGLGLARVDAAAITNVAEDHLGEMGVADLDELVEVKFVVRRAAQHLVLCADDPHVRRRGAALARVSTWYSALPEDDFLRAARARGSAVLQVEDGWIVHRHGALRTALLAVEQAPALLGGAARHNVQNALAAAGLALHLGLDPDAIARGLREFRSDAAGNEGRLNLFRLGELTVLVDFAHNPHGLEAILATAAALPRRRLGVLLGQAGDRDDDSIVALARQVARARPDRVVLKEMAEHLRGRTPGEVVLLLERTLLAEGLAPAAIERAPSELAAARAALEWARAGDLLLLLCHAQRDAVLELVAGLERSAWRPGSALPANPS